MGRSGRGGVRQGSGAERGWVRGLETNLPLAPKRMEKNIQNVSAKARTVLFE